MPATLALPPAFETEIYRAAHADLSAMSDPELVAHYRGFGRREGRVCSRVTSREQLTGMIPAHFRCLEVGPFNVPCLDPHRTDFLDIRDAEQLRRRADDLGLDAAGVPEIRWVSPDGRLSVVSDEYDLVLSSHAIEHQVDLVGHLSEVSRVLVPGGHYFCIIPDARYCFDHFLPLSGIADVLTAFEERRTRHSLESVIEHWAMTCHNDPVRHWAGDHGTQIVDLEQVRRARDAWGDETEVIDVHAWQFSPETFESIVGMLAELGLCDFECARVYPTVCNSIEFYAVLRKVGQ